MSAEDFSDLEDEFFDEFDFEEAPPFTGIATGSLGAAASGGAPGAAPTGAATGAPGATGATGGSPTTVGSTAPAGATGAAPTPAAGAATGTPSLTEVSQEVTGQNTSSEGKSSGLTSEIILEDDDPTEVEIESTISPEEYLALYSDVVLAAALDEGTDEDPASKQRRRWLFSNARPELFRDENYILYNIIYGYRSDNFNVDRDFLEIYLRIHQKDIEESRHKIDINAYGDVDGSAAAGYAAGVIKKYEYLKKLPRIDDSELYRTFEKLVMYFQQIEAAKAYTDSLTILEDGIRSRNNRSMEMGFEDSKNYVQRRLAEIEGLVDRNEGAGYVSFKELVLNPKEDIEIFKVTDYGLLEELNSHYKGVFSGQLITVGAPPKAGKTKFCSRIVHNAVVRDGRNVTIWPVEGGIQLMAAQLRAIHFDHIYNANEADPTKHHNGVSQKTIAFSEWDSSGLSDLQPLEEASARDLVSNANYGNIDLIDKPFELETFLDIIDISVTSNGSSLVMIDYMQLLGSQKNLSKREILSQAYPRLLDYAKKKNVAIISPAQYSQEAIKDIDKATGAKDMRTSVGESAEIIRSSDIIIAMYASPEQIQNRRVRFMSMPTRFAEPFDEFVAYADLGTCTYSSLSGE